MTTIFTTYAPSGSVDHKDWTACEEWINTMDGIYMVAKLEYYGGGWDEGELQFNGDLRWAENYTKAAAEWLSAIWENLPLDELLATNPHPLVETVTCINTVRKEAVAEENEMAARPKFGGM